MSLNEKLATYITEFFQTSELNLFPGQYGGARVFADPSVGVARGDDPVFQKFKEVVYRKHMTPAEVWIENSLPDKPDLAAGLRVLSILFPFVDRIREEGARNTEHMPPELYCLARNLATAFMEAVLGETVALLEREGHRAMAGPGGCSHMIVSRGELFEIQSRWSERHVAYAAGLGTFSLNEALITEKGCNIRVASVITDAPLEITPRTCTDPFSNCIYLSEGACGRCVDKCPARAITKEGHDKRKCLDYSRKVEREMRSRPVGRLLKAYALRINEEDIPFYSVGCGMCQFDTPCSDKNPMA
ncbi:hypothetical protein ACFL1X_14860 [Candidatus Hydrogenedentota bacterium]